MEGKAFLYSGKSWTTQHYKGKCRIYYLLSEFISTI